MLNQVVLQGRLGRDPELRYTPSGVPVATVSIAVSRDFKREDGEREADWISIVAWKNTAEFLANHFEKGNMILVKGRLQGRSYATQDGNKRHVTEVLVDNVYFTGEAKRDNNQDDEMSYIPSSELPF